MSWIAVLAAATLACPVEGARYQLRTATSYTAEFLAVDSGPEWPNGLTLKMTSAKTRQVYWFLPWNGGSDLRRHMASTTDVTAPGWTPPSPDGGPRPFGDLEYIGVDAAFQVLAATPGRGDRAPAHFLLPDLGQALWYRPLDMGVRERPPTQFFDLVACGSARSARRPGRANPGAGMAQDHPGP